MATETELKLRIEPADVGAFLAHPLLQAAAASHRVERLLATYYDTPDQELLQLGVGLRVRCEQGRWLQTVKSAGAGVGSLHQRQEWNVEVAGPAPEYDMLPGAVHALEGFDKKLLARVAPLFTTEFERQTWQLPGPRGAHIELCLDRGEIRAGDAAVPLGEIELELKQGDLGALYETALQLLDLVPLCVENASKAQRGYELHRPRPPRTVKAGKTALREKMSVEEAFVHLAQDCLAQWQGNEAAVLRGEDPEGVHQMRVGIRRLRSLFSLYKDLLPPENSAELREELRWLANTLGPARDWDVFAETVAQIRARSDSNGYLQDLGVRVAGRQAKAYALAQDTLRSPRYTRLVLCFHAWLQGRGWHTEDTATKSLRKAWEQPVRKFADAILQKQHKRVCKKGEHLLDLSPAERHRVRIASKKLAYGARFFADLYPGQVAAAYIRRLSQLRDELGTLHDAAVARHLMDELDLPEDAPPRHFLNGWYAYHNQVKLAELGQIWEEFFSAAGLPLKTK